MTQDGKTTVGTSGPPKRGGADLGPKPDISRDLDEDQRNRYACLHAARSVLLAKGAPFGATQAPDAMDMFHLAQYIRTGRDPWAPKPDFARLTAAIEAQDKPSWWVRRRARRQERRDQRRRRRTLKRETRALEAARDQRRGQLTDGEPPPPPEPPPAEGGVHRADIDVSPASDHAVARNLQQGRDRLVSGGHLDPRDEAVLHDPWAGEWTPCPDFQPAVEEGQQERCPVGGHTSHRFVGQRGWEGWKPDRPQDDLTAVAEATGVLTPDTTSTAASGQPVATHAILACPRVDYHDSHTWRDGDHDHWHCPGLPIPK